MTLDAWWFLLVPVVFGLGWLARGLDSRNNPRDEALPGAYFKGLNFLLNEQPDKAIDAFVDVVRIQPETIELHFALGSLFRRRGETERAIRVHQNLVERNDMSAAQREQALFELGQDYLKAGLLDRAEDAFNRLEGSQYRAAALGHRLRISQMVRDWSQSIALAQQLDQDPAEPRHLEIAHFHCELAENLAAGQKGEGSRAPVAPDLAAARQALTNAIEVNDAHPRAWLMRGRLALRDGDAAGAVDAMRAALTRDSRMAALVAQEWLDAHLSLGLRDEGIAELERIQREAPSVDVLSALHTAVAARDGEVAGMAWLEEALRAAPSLLGYRQLLEARRTHDNGAQTDEIELAQQLIRRQADRLARFVCGQCGFSARKYYWQCPGCNAWDSYSPRRAEELERP